MKFLRDCLIYMTVWMRTIGCFLVRGTTIGLFSLVAMAQQSSAPEQQAYDILLKRTGHSDLVSTWRRATSLEREGRALEREQPALAIERYLDASLAYEQVAISAPELTQAYWRSARTVWAAGDTLPLDATAARLNRFERADTLAKRGLAVDDACAECMLWSFAAMGRIGTTRGIWTSLRQVRKMARLLDEGIALQPTYADDGENSTLGNLHYSSAIFYRVLPDWFFIGWFLGARGDKDRALEHIQQALSLHPTRLDYQLELGSQLLCLGSVRRNSEQLREGEHVMHDALTRTPETQDDARDIAAAEIMLREPAKSCSYTGDTWVEINRSAALHAARQASTKP